MAGVTFRVVDEATPYLQTVRAHLNDFSKPLRLSGLYMQRATAEQFRSKGARSGDAWPSLSKATLKRRRGGGVDAQPLRDTGRLYASIVSRTGDSAYFLTPGSLTMGSNLAYARIHQEGGDIERTTKAGSVRLRRIAGGKIRFAKRRHKRAWDVAYAGGKDYTIHIPARPFLVVTGEDEEQIAQIFARQAVGNG